MVPRKEMPGDVTDSNHARRLCNSGVRGIPAPQNHLLITTFLSV
jgi:hypothetical protein